MMLKTILLDKKLKKYISLKTKICLRNIHLLAKKKHLKIVRQIQSVQFPTTNNTSKFHENRRQKSSAGVAGLNLIISGPESALHSFLLSELPSIERCLARCNSHQIFYITCVPTH